MLKTLDNPQEELLHHLNGLRPTIKFTVEQEEDRTLPFLETLLRRRENSNGFYHLVQGDQ